MFIVSNVFLRGQEAKRARKTIHQLKSDPANVSEIDEFKRIPGVCIGF